MKKHFPRQIVIYKFPKNSATVSVGYRDLSHREERVRQDCLWLSWKTEEGEHNGMGMRPDEALLIAEMLVESVRVITEAYQTSKPIKSYRIRKHKRPR